MSGPRRGGITNLAHSQLNGEVSDLESLAEMYNSQKLTWVHLVPGTERFALRRGPVPNFDLSSLTPEQSALFLSGTATVAPNGAKLRTLYVWESDADRHVYVYTERGEILASFPPPEDYDPYVLARQQIELRESLSEERIEWLIKSLDPTRVVACVTVADGPVAIAPPPLAPGTFAGAPLPGGFGMLGFDPEEEPLSRNVATWVAGLGPRLTFQNPGKGSCIPMWRKDGPDFGADYTLLDQLENVGSDSAEHTDEDAVNLDSRYYYTPFLDTTYVQAPSSSTLTLKYVATRNLTHKARLWRPGQWASAPSETASKASLGSGVYVYEKTFSGLDPDTTYKYTFTWTQDASEEHTAVQTTRTWPQQQDIGEFSFIVYGDNRWDDSSATFNHRHRDLACLGMLTGGRTSELEYPALILHTGDLVNAGGDPTQWIPHFFRPAGALVSRVPVFPCVGNHETSGDSGAAKYKALFKLPENAPNAADKERYYWFDYGDCRFVILDTFYDWGAPEEQRDDFFDEDPDQHEWLRQRLEESGATWKIVVMHVPGYTQAAPAGQGYPAGHGYNAGDVSAVRRELGEKVFNKAQYGVRLVFSGHNHFYERSSVPREGGGTVEYVVAGGGGAPLHNPFGGTTNEYRIEAESVRHYCLVRLTSGGWRLRVEALREDGGQIDAFTLE